MDNSLKVKPIKSEPGDSTSINQIEMPNEKQENEYPIHTTFNIKAEPQENESEFTFSEGTSHETPCSDNMGVEMEEVFIKMEYEDLQNDIVQESLDISNDNKDKTDFEEFQDFQEVILDEDSDEELEEPIDSEEEPIPEEIINKFHPRNPEDFVNILNFTPPYVGINKNAAPNIDANSSPFSIFTLYFKEVFHLLLLETNRYYHQYCESRNVPSETSDITLEDIYKFLALIIQMGHDQRVLIKDYWRKDEQYYTPFYNNTMSRDRFLHILRFLHFSDNNDAPNKDDPNYDRLWKIRKLFDTLNDKFSELYYPTEHIALEELIVLFKGKIIFREYIPKNQRLGIKIFKLNDSLGYTYDMKVHLRTQKKLATVLQLVQKVEGVGHKLFMNSHFSSPLLFDDLLERKINSFGIVKYNRCQFPQDIDPKNIELKKGDIVTRIQGNLSIIRWKDNDDIYLLTNMHLLPADKLPADRLPADWLPADKLPAAQVIEDLHKHTIYVKKVDKMLNSYGIARRTWKWTKKLFFHLLDITILNSFLLHKFVGGNMSYKVFRETLVRNLILEAQGMFITIKSSAGRPSSASMQLSRLDAKYSQHWPSKCKTRRCRVCSTKNKYVRTVYFCKKCDVGLCVVGCFEKWHTLVNF